MNDLADRSHANFRYLAAHLGKSTQTKGTIYQIVAKPPRAVRTILRNVRNENRKIIQRILC